MGGRAHLNPGMSPQESDFYQAGILARADGRAMDACSSLNPVLFAFYKAGWQDEDIRLGVRKFWTLEGKAINERREQ